MSFLTENKGQGSIEYILIVGGVIVATLVVVNIYSEAVRRSGETVLSSVEEFSMTTKNKVLELLKKIG